MLERGWDLKMVERHQVGWKGEKSIVLVQGANSFRFWYSGRRWKVVLRVHACQRDNSSAGENNRRLDAR